MALLKLIELDTKSFGKCFFGTVVRKGACKAQKQLLFNILPPSSFPFYIRYVHLLLYSSGIL
jgi:hypothetical protein